MLTDEQIGFTAASKLELIKPRLFVAIDSIPALKSAGIIYMDAGGGFTTLRQSGHPTLLRTFIVLEEITGRSAESRESKIKSELTGLGINTAVLALTVIGAGAAGAAAVGTAPFWVSAAIIGGAVAAAGNFGLSLGRTVNVFFMPENNEILDASTTYQYLALGLDGLSLLAAGGGVKAVGAAKKAKALLQAAGHAGTEAQKTAAVKRLFKELSAAERRELGAELQKLIAKGAIKGDARKLKSAVNMLVHSGGQMHHLLKIDGSASAVKLLQTEIKKQIAGVFGNAAAPVASILPGSVSSTSGLLNKAVGGAIGFGKEAISKPISLGDFDFYVPLKGNARLRWYLFQQQPKNTA